MNRSSSQNHWIILKLAGVKSNRDGLGTKVKITTSLGTQYNQATTAVSYNSASDKRVHFGLGSAGVVETIELTWPSGIKQVLKKVKADQQNPKMQEWEQLMWKFQQALPGAKPGEKWLRMERIFKLES